MKILKLSLISISIAGIISCEQSNEIIKEKLLTIDTIIDQLSDSSFFSDIRSIYIEKDIFFTDYKRDEIICLNPEYKVKTIIGKKGQGPGEFTGASHVVATNDSIFVFNDFKQSFEMFYKGQYIRTIPLPSGSSYSSSTRFSYKNGRLYFSCYSENYSACYFDFSSDSLIHFGKLEKFKSKIQERLRNQKHITVTNKNIILVSDNIPLIERYSFEGKLIEQYSFRHLDLLKDWLISISKKSVEENSFHVLTTDISCFNNSLFLIIYTMENDKVQKNTVLEFDLTKKIRPVGYYNLNDGWFQSLAIVKNKMIAYDALNGKIIKYTLK